MKKKIFIPIFAIIILGNISFSMIQQDSKINSSLQSLFKINTAEAEHTSTYECWDEEYKTSKEWPYTIEHRVCTAPDCGKNYVRNLWVPDIASCTVYYQ